MKYQEELSKRELVIEDLPKSQQKKITELGKLVSKIEEIESDVDDESREEFEAIKSQVTQADEEIVIFVQNFDVEKAREQRARLAEMRSRIKKPEQNVPEEPKVKIAPVVVAEPVSEPTSKIESTHTAPVKNNEESIAKHIKEIKKEAQISPEEFRNEPQEEPHAVQSPPQAIEVEAEEFEKQAERKPRKVNIPLVVMGVGALILTWGAVNFFKERR
jgi:hypothetical protein